MTTNLTAPLVDAYFAATNASDRERVLATFASDATVDDEGHLVAGHSAIAAWFDEVTATYRPRFRVTGTRHEAGWVVVSTAVSGTFSGGEVLRDHRFLVSGSRITALEIRD